MKVTLLDTQTGQTVELDHFIPPETAVSWWSEGNGSCDCNREICFDSLKEESEFEYVQEEDEDSGSCLGANRYLILDANHPKFDYFEWNSDYLVELALKHAPEHVLNPPHITRVEFCGKEVYNADDFTENPMNNEINSDIPPMFPSGPILPQTSISPVQMEQVVVERLFKAVEAVDANDLDEMQQAIKNYGDFLHTISLRTMVGFSTPY